jgi:hypothetical protein
MTMKILTHLGLLLAGATLIVLGILILPIAAYTVPVGILLVHRSSWDAGLRVVLNKAIDVLSKMRALLGAALAVLLVGGLVVSASACGPNARERTISATLHTLDAARHGFTAWSAEHQRQINTEVRRSGGFQEDADELRAKFRADRVPVVDALDAAYSLLGAAAVDRSMSLTAALQAFQDALVAIDKFRQSVEAPPPASRPTSPPKSSLWQPHERDPAGNIAVVYLAAIGGER